MLKQVSIYTENNKGKMRKITEILAEKNINILGSVTNDSAEYGIIRMIVSNPELTIEALTAAGYICKMTDVIGVEVTDEVGNLNKLLEALEYSNINVDYLYLSFNRITCMPIMVFHADCAHEVEECLRQKGFSISKGEN
ncbi:MAG: amino acid-binding protein [Lachnospiraceae bacterium]|jgi:hypothetical protein|nr:amino acid-binding protein [Lachnospiraceae bacterium]